MLEEKKEFGIVGTFAILDTNNKIPNLALKKCFGHKQNKKTFVRRVGVDFHLIKKLSQIQTFLLADIFFQ